jgi:hypothetical protein
MLRATAGSRHRSHTVKRRVIYTGLVRHSSHLRVRLDIALTSHLRTRPRHRIARIATGMARLRAPELWHMGEGSSEGRL